MAAGKLQEIVPTRPITYRNQNLVNLSLLAVGGGRRRLPVVFDPDFWPAYVAIVVLSLVFGVLLIMPIGGADMPTVISLLNSYAGLSAVAMGFVLDNKLLIIAGALDGSSGLILSIIMCQAMNRSFTNVLFGAFGQVQASRGGRRSQDGQERHAAGRRRHHDAAPIASSSSPATAWRSRRRSTASASCTTSSTKRGVDVKFAIHPVAGRMPGHMNVLLAEAEIPYEALVEMDDINPEMPQTDVCLVIGANDVVNPAARHDKGSPIFGMPIIDADKAKTVIAIKRSMNPGLRRHRERALLRRADADGLRRREAGARRRRQGGLRRGRRALTLRAASSVKRDATDARNNSTRAAPTAAPRVRAIKWTGTSRHLQGQAAFPVRRAHATVACGEASRRLCGRRTARPAAEFCNRAHGSVAREPAFTP